MRLSHVLRLPGRLALTAALIGVTGAAAATPAQAAAEPEAPSIELFVPSPVVTTDGATKTVPIEVVNAGDTAAPGLVLQFGTPGSAIDPRIGFQPPQGCTAAGCAIGELAPGAHKSYAVTVTPTAPLPEAGVTFDVTVHDAGAVWKKSTTVTVLRAAQGIDLEAGHIADISLAPGKSAAVPIAVRNNGNSTAAGVGLELAGTPFVTFLDKYTNCIEAEILPGIVCIFDQPLPAGQVFTISPSTPLIVQTAAIAPGPADYRLSMSVYEFDNPATNSKLAAAQRAAKEPGTRAELVPVQQGIADVHQSELNQWDNTTSFFVKVPLNPADTVAVGDTFEGAIGDTRTVKVGFRNDGPAVVLGPPGEWKLSAKVRIPSGLALTKVDKGCVPNGDGDPSWDHPGQVSGHDYLCVATAPLGVHAEKLFSFTAKIEDGENEDEGSITVDGGVQERKQSNNVAKIDVKVPADGGSGGSSGGGLPITGAPAGGIAGTGLLLVLAGGLLLVLTRRRAVPLRK